MRGGWKGKNIDWNPQEPVLPTGENEYSLRRKLKEEGEMEETIVTLRALIHERHKDDGLDIDLEDDEDASLHERPILREAE